LNRSELGAEPPNPRSELGAKPPNPRKRTPPRRILTQSAPAQGMIEYGLIIALISIAAIALLVLFKAPLVNLFSNAVSSLGG